MGRGGAGRRRGHIVYWEILGNMLVLAGHEGYHVVERNCFHRSEFGWNGLFPPSIPGFLKIASVLCRCLVTIPNCVLRNDR